jgi:hypothetical protein
MLMRATGCTTHLVSALLFYSPLVHPSLILHAQTAWPRDGRVALYSSPPPGSRTPRSVFLRCAAIRTRPGSSDLRSLMLICEETRTAQKLDRGPPGGLGPPDAMSKHARGRMLKRRMRANSALEMRELTLGSAGREPAHAHGDIHDPCRRLRDTRSVFPT